MIDLVKLRFKAGDGGHGRVSFRREKFVPKGGPDGGMGGDGGSIWLVASDHWATLQHLAGKKAYEAPAGELGGRRQQTGAKGEDLVLEVPVGTTVWVIAENGPARARRSFTPSERHPYPPVKNRQYWLTEEGAGIPWLEPPQLSLDDEVAEQLNRPPSKFDVRALPKIELHTFTQPGERLLLCKGGHGGRGNESFKSSTMTTPLTAEYGTPGEERLVLLEQKLLAEVGLVGFPNAGKSTLLSVLTKARPKIANYPFTTLEPQLGVAELAEGKQVVVADIPGLIAGASEGKGLGLRFLRHVENCRSLLFLVGLEDEQLTAVAELVTDEKAWLKEVSEVLIAQINEVRQELKAYAPELLDKAWQVVITKADLYPADWLSELRQRVAKQVAVPVLVISAATGQGISELKHVLVGV